MGKKHAMMIAAGVSAVGLLPLLGSLQMELLFPLRLITGSANGLMICLGETWINELSEENKRGRVLAVYTTVFTVSQLLGPSIIALYGIEDNTPILICTLIHIFSLVLFVMMDQNKGNKLPRHGLHWYKLVSIFQGMNGLLLMRRRLCCGGLGVCLAHCLQV